jgi:NADH-quinone oxidoreductase subunit J
MADFLFILIATLTLACAAGVVLNRNAVNAAMCLLLCLAGVAGLLVRLDAFLLAFLLLLVYAGAVVALFVFIVMLLDARGGSPQARTLLSRGAGIVGAALVLAGVLSLLARARLSLPAPPPVPVLGASLKLYAYQLFTLYLLPVEVVGFLLLITMIGVIVISQRNRPGQP